MCPGDRSDRLRDWYERELGWATCAAAPGPDDLCRPDYRTDPDGRCGPDGPGGPHRAGVALETGVRFDVLDVPVAAAVEVLRRFPRTGPAAVCGTRALLLVAAGAAEELPGLLGWLDWGGIELDLVVRGAGGRMPAPGIPWERTAATAGPDVALWLRPPEPGREVESTLPSVALTESGLRTGVVGLVRLVGAVATECHRTRILPARTGRPTDSRPTERRPAERLTGQPWAFSYASRMLAGTRPRSLTS